MGRYGDTELVHLNKEEKKLIERYRGAKLSKNPKTGLSEGWSEQAKRYAAQSKQNKSMFTMSYKGYKEFQAQETKLEGEQKIAEAALAAKEKAIAAAKKIQPGEAAAMARMRKGAASGTMDVQALNRQMSQPIYQQGQAQQASALGQITRQGLEGSVIAQETSRKIGADVRSSIAEQARQIAFNNEQTKARAEQNLQGALMKRGALLRDLATKKAGLSTEQDIINLRTKYGMDLFSQQQHINTVQQMEDTAMGIVTGGLAGGGGGGDTTYDFSGGGYGTQQPTSNS